MSDGKEVKQKDIHIHHQSGKAFILVELHNRIMAERDELWKRATKFVMPGEMDTGESIEHYIKTLEQTIASQARVIEKLREQRERYAKDVQEALGSPNFYRRDEKELEAIEQGEGM